MGEGKTEPQERRYYDTVHSRSSDSAQPTQTLKKPEDSVGQPPKSKEKMGVIFKWGVAELG